MHLRSFEFIFLSHDQKCNFPDHLLSAVTSVPAQTINGTYAKAAMTYSRYMGG